MIEFTQSEKRIMYKNGQYQFKAPPVCTAQWDIDAWIKFVDTCNGWRPVRELPVYVHPSKWNSKEQNFDK